MNPSVHHLGPAPGDARAAVLFLHGRGSSGSDVTGLADALPVNGVAWLAPSAAGGTWYPLRFVVPTAENEPHLGNALGTVDQLFGKLRAAGLPPERIGLAGFSQGACLALEYAARRPRRYGFVAALSGALIGPLETPRPPFDLAGTPVLLGCAEHDAHVPPEYVEHTACVLAEASTDLTRQRFPGSAHTVFPEEIEWMRRALERIAAA